MQCPTSLQFHYITPDQKVGEQENRLNAMVFKSQAIRSTVRT